MPIVRRKSGSFKTNYVTIGLFALAPWFAKTLCCNLKYLRKLTLFVIRCGTVVGVVICSKTALIVIYFWNNFLNGLEVHNNDTWKRP